MQESFGKAQAGASNVPGVRVSSRNSAFGPSLAREKREIIESVKRKVSEKVSVSTDPDVRKAGQAFEKLCENTDGVLDALDSTKPGFGARVLATFIFFLVSAANVLAKIVGLEIFDMFEFLVETAANDLKALEKQSDDVELRSELFKHFKDFIEKMPKNEMASMKSEDRVNFLLAASIISEEDTKQWMSDMPNSMYDHVVGGDLNRYLVGGDTRAENMENFSTSGVMLLREILAAAPAAVKQRDPTPIENLDLTSQVRPGSVITLGGFVQTHAHLLSGASMSENDVISFSEGDVSGFYGLFPSAMSREEAVALGVISPKDPVSLGAKVRILSIAFCGVDSVGKGLGALKNILGGKPQAIEDAENFVDGIIEKFETKVVDNEVIVPYFIGHSMGGMLAQAMAVEYGAGCTTFNPLGMGKAILDCLEKNRKNSVVEAQASGRFMAFCSQNDWLSGGPRGNILGNQYLVSHNYPHGVGGILNPKNHDIHGSVARQIDDHLEKQRRQALCNIPRKTIVT